MVKDHRDNERGNPLLPLHGLLSLTIISSYLGLMFTILAGCYSTRLSWAHTPVMSQAL